MTNSSKKSKSEEKAVKPRILRENQTNKEYKKEIEEWKFKDSKTRSQKESSA